jgi:CDP-2,3-bis-(O-geranylgeranyl)-sn-glycerol synthase
MHLLLILQLLFLLMIANGTPIIAKRIFGSYFSWPLDGGISFFDGQPLFGRSKTIRGVAGAIIVTAAVAPLVGINFSIGATIAATAMFDDLLSSFTKRRLQSHPTHPSQSLYIITRQRMCARHSKRGGLRQVPLPTDRTKVDWEG